MEDRKADKSRLLNENASLESMIPGLNGVKEIESPLDKPSTIKFTDFDKIIQECDDDALMIVTNTALFYVTIEDLRKEKRLADKITMDKMELSNLIFQSKSAKTSYVKLLEEIDAGNVHPRIFEVQSSLQKSMMEITKSKTAFIAIMENSWRNIRQELDVRAAVHQIDSPEEVKNPGGGTRSRGTRDFIKEIHGEIEDEKSIENAMKDEPQSDK